MITKPPRRYRSDLNRAISSDDVRATGSHLAEASAMVRSGFGSFVVRSSIVVPAFGELAAAAVYVLNMPHRSR